MKVYKGLPHQKGYGLPALLPLLKFGVPVAAGLVGELAGGLIKRRFQKGRGIGDFLKGQVARLDSKIRGTASDIGDVLKGKVGQIDRRIRRTAKRGVQNLYGKAMRAASGKPHMQDFIQALGNTGVDVADRNRSLAQGLRHYGTHALKLTGNRLIEQKLNPILSKPVIGPILRSTVMPVVRRKVDSAIEGVVHKVLGQRGKGVATNLLKAGFKAAGPMMKSGIKAIFRRGVKKQLKRGAKKLAQTAAEQAISSATKAGMDVLQGKNVKQAVQQRTAEALSNTSQVAKQTVNKTSQATKKAVKRAAAPILARSAALDLTPVPVKRKKKRAGDIFD